MLINHIHMKIINSTIEDIDVLFQIYEEAITLQKAIGNNSWKGFERTAVEQEILVQQQWKIIIDGSIAGVFQITTSDPIIWEERNLDPSLYIHRIAISTKFRGRSLVKHILNWATSYAAENNKEYLRIDTGSGNERLINYYLSLGFKYQGDKTFPDTPDLPKHYRNASMSLFEIRL
jgi:ribosomal protein S18 acetylase RimI-like enzyme